MERWLAEINSKYSSGAAHTFLLHLNVSDLFLACAKDGERLESLPARLISDSPLSKAKFVAFYNLGEGIRFVNDKMENEFLQFLEILFPERLPNELGSGNMTVEEFKKKRKSLSYAMGLFSMFLKYSWQDISQMYAKKEGLAELLKIPADSSEDPFFGVIFEFSERIAPPDSGSTYCEADRISLVSLLAMARDQAIHSTHNGIFILAKSLSSVADDLRSETNGIIPVKIDFPNFEAREPLYSWLRKDYPARQDDFTKQENLDASAFGRHSAGMSSNAIISLVKELSYRSEPLTMATLFDRKKKFIEDQSGGLLEVIKPLWGIRAIGALDEHKKCIREVVHHMRSGNLSSVPTGILLMGAPGTGKTVFAQAISYEAELPFVSLKNIREMWVGQSERNLDFALELIVVLAPVVVFMDEIDQEMQMRSSGPAGDSGVNQRLQSKLFQFMSDTNLRGKILWIAASNRPDLMDPALLREGRFDDKIPFFPPSSKERAAIVKALLHKFEVLANANKTQLNLGDISDEDIEKFARRAHCHIDDKRIVKCDLDEFHSFQDVSIDKDDDKVVYMTGGQLENIIRTALKNASLDGTKMNIKHLFNALEDYIPPEDMVDHQQTTELSLRYCNSMRFIPKEGRWYKAARRLGIIRASNTAKPQLSE